MCCTLAKTLHATGVTTVVGVDNPWEGTFSQYIRCFVEWLYLPKLFDSSWSLVKLRQSA